MCSTSEGLTMPRTPRTPARYVATAPDGSIDKAGVSSTDGSGRNEAGWDRAIRTLVGLAALSTALHGLRTPWGWLGLYPLATGLVGFCPLYQIVGFSSRKASYSIPSGR